MPECWTVWYGNSPVRYCPEMLDDRLLTPPASASMPMPSNDWTAQNARSAAYQHQSLPSAENGKTLSLPTEFIQSAEPPAEQFLEKLREMEMPATRPLTYAEVATKWLHQTCSSPDGGQPHIHQTWRGHSTSPNLLWLLQGAGLPSPIWG
jgi:hypothetical protein